MVPPAGGGGGGEAGEGCRCGAAVCDIVATVYIGRCTGESIKFSPIPQTPYPAVQSRYRIDDELSLSDVNTA